MPKQFELMIFHRLGPLGRVGQRVAMFVCLYVTKIVIVDNGRSIRFLSFSLNSVGKYGSKDSKS